MGKNLKPKKEKSKREQLMEKLKIEAAQELGLFEKAKRFGWENLTAQETGRIGASVKKKLKNIKAKLK